LKLNNLNRPREIRQQLGLNKTEAGRLLLGIQDAAAANSTWGKMERDADAGKKLSSGMQLALGILMILSVCKDLKTPGAHKALDIIIDTLKEG
jgi:hypothetical protein